MGKQASIHFVQTVIICTCVLLHHVPIAVITQLSHSLKKYFLVKKYTHIYIYSPEYSAAETRKVTHWLVSLGADAFTWCCTAQHSTKMICSRIYRNMASQPKTRHKHWEVILGQLQLIWGIKHILLCSISYYGMEIFILLVDVYPLKILTDRNFINTTRRKSW